MSSTVGDTCSLFAFICIYIYISFFLFIPLKRHATENGPTFIIKQWHANWTRQRNSKFRNYNLFLFFTWIASILLLIIVIFDVLEISLQFTKTRMQTFYVWEKEGVCFFYLFCTQKMYGNCTLKPQAKLFRREENNLFRIGGLVGKLWNFYGVETEVQICLSKKNVFFLFQSWFLWVTWKYFL